MTDLAFLIGAFFILIALLWALADMINKHGGQRK